MSTKSIFVCRLLAVLVIASTLPVTAVEETRRQGAVVEQQFELVGPDSGFGMLNYPRVQYDPLENAHTIAMGQFTVRVTPNLPTGWAEISRVDEDGNLETGFLRLRTITDSTKMERWSRQLRSETQWISMRNLGRSSFRRAGRSMSSTTKTAK